MKRVWIVIVCTILLLFTVAIWILLPGKSVVSGKDEAKVLRSLLGRDPHLVSDSVTPTWDIHKSPYETFSYPSWAKVYNADNEKALQQPGVKDSFAFTLLDDHLYGVVQVVQFDNKLSEYPAVALRLSQQTIYTPTSSESANTTQIEFKKEQDMVERSAFFLKNGNVVSIAVTGYSDAKVEDLFTKTLGSLKMF